MDHAIAIFLLDLALIPLLAIGFGWIAERLGQPPVIGEILVGLLLGAALLHNHVTAALLPAQVRSFLTCVADLGLALFMFLVGAELDHATVRGSGRVVVGTAIGATLVPFGLGALLGLHLAPHYAHGRHLEFVLFMGVAMSVTAFPVLARIIADLGLGPTLIGSIALSAAAICDPIAWTALAVVQATAGTGDRPWLVLVFVPLVVVSVVVLRPLLRRLVIERERADGELFLDGTRFCLVLAGLLVSAAVTQLCGLHFIFGAFLFGLMLPRDGSLLAELRERLDITAVLLLPVYFVVAGLSVDLSGFGAGDLLTLALIVVTAVVGKFGGALLGARMEGLTWRRSALLATLMNTRGLTELVMLGVGLQLGVLDRKLYALMVAMALLTTVMSGPLARRLAAREPGLRAARAPAAV